MRKGLVILQVLAFLALAGGATAYAYSTGTGEVNTPEPTGNIATTAVAGAQPDWNSIVSGNITVSGNVSTGDLFEITPAEGLAEYLQVRVYLTNTGSLLKAYSHLSLNVYLQDSVEASGSPDYRVLSLENGSATLNLPPGVEGSKTLSVVGGSYQLVSDNTTNWQEGWTVVPELYPEVGQR
ncbi:MAG: hypothetical protein C4555_05550 [Dehalococcoidia bacterium]|nr:MAG: hypothetical protein C4555_05550 [Dehalococcoidia bacterium]